MLTTVDAETERHRQTWLGFVRFTKIMTTLIILLLIGLAIFVVPGSLPGK
jgi:hypothetical protein